MKERELRNHADCSLCQKPIGNSRLPLFWVVTVERHGLNMNALRRQQGLAMVIGDAAIAAVMGPDEDMTTPVMEAVKLTVCETCATERALLVAAMVMP